MLYPPPGYTQIDEGIHRACTPVLDHNIRFLDLLHLDVIFNLTGANLDASVVSFAEECEVTVYDLDSLTTAKSAEEVTADIGSCMASLKKILELLLTSHESVILLIGDPRTVLDAIAIAALRQMQNWCFTSIVTEFRSLTGRKMFEHEQFLESIDLSSITIPSTMPRYAYLRNQQHPNCIDVLIHREFVQLFFSIYFVSKTFRTVNLYTLKLRLLI